LEKKWLEGSTGLKNDPQGRQVFPLAGTPLGKFLATLLVVSIDNKSLKSAKASEEIYSLEIIGNQSFPKVKILNLGIYLHCFYMKMFYTSKRNEHY
jgi:hypothetical protein